MIPPRILGPFSIRFSAQTALSVTPGMKLSLRITADQPGECPVTKMDSFGKVEYFIDPCILAGEQPLSTLDDAADALRILMAAERFVAKPEIMEKVAFE